MTLLEQLRNASFATAQKELDSLRQFAAAQVSQLNIYSVTTLRESTSLLCLKTGSSCWSLLQGFTQTLMNWDQSYYAQKQQQALFNLTDEDVRPYFAYPTVLAGLHQVCPESVPPPVEMDPNLTRDTLLGMSAVPSRPLALW